MNIPIIRFAGFLPESMHFRQYTNTFFELASQPIVFLNLGENYLLIVIFIYGI